MFRTVTALPSGRSLFRGLLPALLLALPACDRSATEPVLADAPSFAKGGGSSNLVPSAKGKIAFMSNRTGSWQIFVRDTASTSDVQLTKGVGNNTFPAWSPDYTKLAFTSTRDGNGEIYVMNADGSGATRLTKDAVDDWGPSWSPDGTRIVFISRRNGGQKLFVMDAKGKGITQLAACPLGVADRPHWSPDGTRILFTCHNHPASDLYTVLANGTGMQRITDSGKAHSGQWTPDGDTVVFMNGLQQIQSIMPAYAYSLKTIYFYKDEYIDTPALSPDGTKIAMRVNELWTGGSYDIYTIDIDGGNLRKVVGHAASDFAPAWGR